MILEKLTEELDSFGLFQILLTFFTTAPKAIIAWSMMIPAFAGVVPDWWCVPEWMEINKTTYRVNTTYKMCRLANETTCTRVYEDSMETIVSEWDLVCEKRLISKTIAATQMSGVLIGGILAGQIADSFGRKKTLFMSIGLHAVFALVCAFSVNWQMYAVFRFLIGIVIGSYIGSYFPYTLEFLGNKWRPFLSAVPIWEIGMIFLAGFAYLCPNWSYLHMAASGLLVPFLLGWFFVPESLRWLTVKCRVDEAETVVDQIVKYNKRPKPADTRSRLERVAEEERAERETRRKYTYLDTVRGWRMLRTTLCCSFIWFSSSVMYYGMSFGVSGLSGNLYLNMFFLALVEVPGQVSLFWLSNK